MVNVKLIIVRDLAGDSPGTPGVPCPPLIKNKFLLVPAVPTSINTGHKSVTLWSHSSIKRWTNGTSFVITEDTDWRETAGF